MAVRHPHIPKKARFWLLFEFTGRKWVIVVVLLFVLAVAIEIGVALLPHSVQNTYLKYEEKSNGIREFFPNGVREVPPQRSGGAHTRTAP